ncbi:hypothetical protein [Piscinibacter sp.]|uniref:hypothetical protein n=1 Tax=Piscinibacter sp. TaxID=1903157 RepID=UPI002BC5185F|nr:hypothetical protein [Albitalea sp.]HUG22860.1 hypothetical protein [Albitalea sp.]
MRRAFALVVASVLGCCASTATALGFGPVTNATRLGQPLDFAVVVKLDAGESLASDCISADVMAGDQRVAPPQVRARLARTSRANEAVAHIATTTRINEPVVTGLLSLGCPPRLSHKFVSLLDPPRAAAPQRAAAGSGRSIAAAPAVEAVPTAAPGAGVAMTAAPEDTEQSEWMQGLEQRVARLDEDAQALHQSVEALQERLREAQRARATDPAMYGLMALVVMLLGVIAVLLWRQSRMQSERSWRKEADALSELAARPFEAGRTAPNTPPPDDATVTSMRVLTDAPDQLTVAPSDAALAEPPAMLTPHELSTEELIDLEQQADFFVALGQEEAAIDLLMHHVRSSGGTSPMPYLKLLEIYRRRGESEAYERIRERFNQRFNAHAPPWTVDAALGRTLEEYATVLQRLQAAWPKPASVMRALESLLFRSESPQAPFDLPAYEELLFLYALARDLAEHEISVQHVDLLLPLDDGDEASAIVRADVTRPPAGRSQRPVDVELDLGHSRPRKD